MRTALLLFLLTAYVHAATSTQKLTPADYQAQLNRIRSMLRQCRAATQACDVEKIGPDDAVAGDPAFEVHWDWLRAVVEQTAAGKPDDSTERQQRLADAAARVESMAQESGPGSTDDPGARAAADRILATPEFRHVHELSWWDRTIARFWSWLGRLFGGLAGVAPYVGWLVPVLEWGAVLLAGTGLLLWVRRVLGRQRLALSLETPAIQGDVMERQRQWAETARLAAEAADWREAVHALYWASVVVLEGRMVWRQHRGRTPREYLSLLDAASPYRIPVAQMTRIFERIWYGLRPAAQEDYTRVLALYEALRSA